MPVISARLVTAKSCHSWVAPRPETTSQDGADLSDPPSAAEQRRVTRAAYGVAVDSRLCVDSRPVQRRRHHDRPGPSAAVVDLERERTPVPQRNGITGLGAGLADGARDR